MTARARTAKGSASQDNTDSVLLQEDTVSFDRLEVMFTRLTKMVSDSFSTCIAHLVTTTESKMDTKLDAHSSELFALNTRVDHLERRVQDLVTANAATKSALVDSQARELQLRTELEGLEQYTRSDSVLVHGVPLPPSGQAEDLLSTVPTVINSLLPGVNLSPDLISAIHRLPSAAAGSSAGASQQSSRKPPPVLIRFTRKLTRVNIMANRRFLKGKSISISDHLTPVRASILRKATALVTSSKLTGAWSQDGRILVKTLSNRVLQINQEAELAQYA
jgi:hypothetical protein